MWTAIKTLFGGTASMLLEWLAIAGSATAVIAEIFSQGKKSEQATELKQQAVMEAKAHEVEDTNRATLPDGAAAAKLREDWSR